MLTLEKEGLAKEFLNIQDLSQFLGIKTSTLYAMVEEKRLPHYRIGRLIRFKRSEIDLWLESHKEECADADKRAGRILSAIRSPQRDIEKIVKKAIDGIRAKGYTIPHGKPDQVKGLGKEVHDGSV